VMNERAHSVDLDPQIEASCLADLGEFCSDKTGKSEVSIITPLLFAIVLNTVCGGNFYKILL